MLNNLKNKAQKLKDKSIAEAKKFTEDQLPEEKISKFKDAANKAIGKVKQNSSASDSKSSVSLGQKNKPESEQVIKDKSSNNHYPVDTKGAEMTAESAIEDLLNVRLPDWNSLKKRSDTIMKDKQPEGMIQWMKNDLPIAKKHVKKGGDYDLWTDDDQLILRARPSIMEKIIYAILSLQTS